MSIGQMVRQFVTFFIGVLQSDKNTFTKYYQGRIIVCINCNENIGNKLFPRCGRCGCFMRLKAKFRIAECEKWGMFNEV